MLIRRVLRLVNVLEPLLDKPNFPLPLNQSFQELPRRWDTESLFIVDMVLVGPVCVVLIGCISDVNERVAKVSFWLSSSPVNLPSRPVCLHVSLLLAPLQETTYQHEVFPSQY